VTSFPTALPTSRIPDPAAAPPLRWGILGPGGIAHAFADAMRRHTRQQVVAVGSRSTERARAFADEFGVERVHGSYEALVRDPEVDVVYVASPHSGHRDHALLAIAAGKHVLVEKSFTRNAAEAAEVVAAAGAAGVVAMEAMWTRFLPQTDVLRQLLADGVLGELSTVLADHGQYFVPDPTHRLFAPELAGGAMLDLGIYPVSFASFVLGRPDAVTAVGRRTETGVDAQVSMVLQTGQVSAVLDTTLSALTPTRAAVCGSAARVELATPFYASVAMTLVAQDGSRLVREADSYPGHEGLCHEAAHLAQLVAENLPESPLLPLSETVQILRTVDEVRRQVGVRLPGE